MNLWVSIGLVQRVDGLMLWVPNPSPPWLFPKKPGSCGPRKTHEKIYQGPCLSSSKLSEGRSFWVSGLMGGKTKALQYCRDFYDYPAIGNCSEVIGYHIVSQDVFWLFWRLQLDVFFYFPWQKRNHPLAQIIDWFVLNQWDFCWSFLEGWKSTRYAKKSTQGFQNLMS